MSESPGNSWKTFSDFVAQSERSLPDIDSDRFVSYNLEDLYPDWQDRAHCKGTGLEYYFGVDEDGFESRIAQVRRASKLCDVCPVYRDCLSHALTQREEYGVWAGTSGRVRRKIFKMLDNDEVTTDQVVEDFYHGDRAKYTGNGGSRTGREQGGNSVPAGESREVAL